MNRFSVLSFLLFSAILTPMLAFANYKVTPLVIDREVSPRDIFSETITITNNKNYKINVYPSVNAVAIDDGGDITDFSPPSMSDGKVTVTSWLSISRGRQSIEPGQSVQIPLHVKIHPEAKPGIYHAMLGFGTGSNRDEAVTKVKNSQAPGVIVTLKVDQDQTEFLKLGRFFIDKFVTASDNSAANYTLSNPGEAEVVPTGEIIFYNSRGEEVTSIPVNPSRDTLLPGQETTYTTAVPISGMLGKYKGFLSVDYGSSQVASVYDTTFFYVVPWQKLLMIFGTIMVIVVVLTVYLHRRYAGAELEEENTDHVPLFVSESVSEGKDHDINLKS